MIIEIVSAVSVFVFVVAYSHMLTIMNRDRYIRLNEDSEDD